MTDGSVPVLEAVNLAKHYRVRTKRFARSGVVRAAEGVSLALHRGRVTAVVGESGSGKSTVSRMLARTTAPTAGELWLDGSRIDTRHAADRDYRAQVQLVLQDPFASLNPVHDVRYILSRPLKIHGYAGDDIDESIKTLLRRVALEPADQFIDKYPHELSGGQRQRVAIARALAVRPKVLLADEPVSMLDVSIRLGVLNLLADLRDREGLAILYVTHDIASARYLADTIVVMYAGRIVESGPAERVTDDPSHPYTQLLLSAAPDPDAGRPERLGERGAPPSLVSPPSGCRFHPRCPFVMPVCRDQSPPMLATGTGHASACWLHADRGATEPMPAPRRETGAPMT
ncbi:MAG TPA: ABC transporter ATP-binding protein [Micromonosporaceae bacterium]